MFECTELERTALKVDLKKHARHIINVDHHLFNANYGSINYVDPKASSTTDMVYKIIQHSGFPLTKDEALCIYAGLVTDTGWFKYGNTTPESHRIAAALLEMGVKVTDVYEKIQLGRSLAAVNLLGWALSHMDLFYEGRVAVMTIPRTVYEKNGATPDDMDEIVNYGLLMDKTVVSILLRENPDQISVKVSFRSKNAWDVNQIARSFGGGGHKNASGCTLNAPLSDSREKIIQSVAHLF